MKHLAESDLLYVEVDEASAMFRDGLFDLLEDAVRGGMSFDQSLAYLVAVTIAGLQVRYPNDSIDLLMDKLNSLARADWLLQQSATKI